MASVKIVGFRASWHPKNNRGVIEFDVVPGGIERWKGTNASEFSAILGILNAADKPYLTSSGWVSTGIEEPDDE